MENTGKTALPLKGCVEMVSRLGILSSNENRLLAGIFSNSILSQTEVLPPIIII
jgi:hypothetical protein